VTAGLLFAAAWTLARDRGFAQEPSRRIMVALLLFTSVPLVFRALILSPHFGADAVDVVPLRPSLESALAFFPPLILAQSFGLAFVTVHRERAAAVAHLQATTDSLTGCLNRRALEERAHAEIAYAIRNGRPLGVLIADLDHFKLVNDTHGHAAGDAVLAAAARILRETVRPSDVVARYGGEEFCVLLRDAGPEAVRAIGARLRLALAEKPMSQHGSRIAVTASFGGTALRDQQPESWETLFRRADAALYRAKQAGRDRVETET
jgi:diguanylate cyclase (GGDEF)-like protein